MNLIKGEGRCVFVCVLEETCSRLKSICVCKTVLCPLTKSIKANAFNIKKKNSVFFSLLSQWFRVWVLSFFYNFNPLKA